MARRMSRLLESFLGLPHWLPFAKRWRIGADGIVGLIPGIGDLITTVMGITVLWAAHRLGAPLPLLGRMLMMLLLDLLIGAVPVLGDVLDFFWKANLYNLDLLEKAYQRDGHRWQRPRELWPPRHDPFRKVWAPHDAGSHSRVIDVQADVARR
jgi:hypothetical protein